MPCYHPQDVIRSKRVVHPKSGKPVSFFNKSYRRFKSFWNSSSSHIEWYQPEEFQLAGCKYKLGYYCVGCIEDYSRQWAVRAWHHSNMFDSNCFITLTFNDKFVPKSLDHRFWQLFMKRFRKRICFKVPKGLGKADRKAYLKRYGISFFMSGEYGSLNLRPHFHACLFNYDFPDKVLWSVRDSVRLYVSKMLSELWSCPKTGESYGFSSVGEVTFESAAYIARYVGKKAQRAELPPGLRPEYSKCSLKYPIGKEWFLSFQSSVFPCDNVSLPSGDKVKVPRYYDKLLANLTDAELADKIKSRRKERAKASPDNTPERLAQRESVKKDQLKQLKRSL